MPESQGKGSEITSLEANGQQTIKY